MSRYKKICLITTRRPRLPTNLGRSLFPWQLADGLWSRPNVDGLLGVQVTQHVDGASRPHDLDSIQPRHEPVEDDVRPIEAHAGYVEANGNIWLASSLYSDVYTTDESVQNEEGCGHQTEGKVAQEKNDAR